MPRKKLEIQPIQELLPAPEPDWDVVEAMTFGGRIDSQLPLALLKRCYAQAGEAAAANDHKAFATLLSALKGYVELEIELRRGKGQPPPQLHAHIHEHNVSEENRTQSTDARGRRLSEIAERFGVRGFSVGDSED